MFIFETATMDFPETSEVANNCSHCDKETKTEWTQSIHYFSIYSLPFFAFKSTVTNHCNKCGNSKVLQANRRQKLNFINRFCLHQLGLILALIVAYQWGYAQYQQHKENQQEIAAPLKHDIYFVDHFIQDPTQPLKYRYSLYKVIATEEQQVKVVKSNYSYESKSDIKKHIRNDKLALKNYFKETADGFSLSELAALHQNDVIYDIGRSKDNMTLYGGVVILPAKPVSRIKYQPGQDDNNLAIAYFNGERVEQDYAAALELFTESANKGFHWGQLNLARMYINGHATEVNLITAKSWLEKAIEQGNKVAEHQLEQLCDTSLDCS